MKNKVYRPGILASLTLFSPVLLALGCGNADKNPAEETPAVVPPDPCEVNSLLAQCLPDELEGNGGGSGEGGGGGEVTPPEPPAERDLIQAAAENVLRVNCGQCHGPNLSQDAARARMNYIDDIDALVENGQIIPRRSRESKVVTYMENGTMPPPGVQPRPSQREIDLVASFIDNPLYWPPQPGVALCNEQLRTFDDVYSDVSDDLRRAESEDQPFLRYVTIANRYNSGVCNTELDEDRWALAKVVNMLSTRTSIEVPRVVDAEKTIYAIDIRDYEWDREIEVNGTVFADGWEAIIAASPYAIPFVGDDADTVREDSGTNVAVLSLDGLIEVASFGNLYYALIGVDVNQPLATFISDDLGIDVVENLEQRDLVRAGTTESILSRQDRVLERHEIGVRGGAYWQSFDFQANVVNDSIFLDPFGFNEGGTEAIFSLPNGMLGFVIADENDAIAQESNILLDTFADDFIARTSVSCSGCHAQGFNEASDEVRDFALANRLEFVADDFQAIKDIYVDKAEFARIVAADSREYQFSLNEAGIPTEGDDPLSLVFLRFETDIDLARAAGDLGLTAEILGRDLRELNPALQVLNQSRGADNRRIPKVDRDVFTNVYLESLCILQRPFENQPDPVLCAEVIE